VYFPTIQFLQAINSKVTQHCSSETVGWSRPSTIASNRFLQFAQCESTSFKITVPTKIAPVLALSATPPLTMVTQVVQKIHWKKHWTSRLTQPGLSCRMDLAKPEHPSRCTGHNSLSISKSHLQKGINGIKACGVSLHAWKIYENLSRQKNCKAGNCHLRSSDLH
jgi:hypothetical protein